MIRIKCPKCSETLSVEDEEAGGVGECTKCGAKFRIPAAKPKAKAPAPREDDDDDDEDDEDRPASKRPAAKKKPLPSSISYASDADSPERALIEREKAARLAEIAARDKSACIQMAIILFVMAIFLAIASIFLNRVAIYTAVIGVVLQVLTQIMLAAKAKQESAFWAFMVRALPGMVIVFGMMHWDMYKKFVIANIGGGLILAGGVLGYYIHADRQAAKRATIEERIKSAQVLEIRPYQTV